MSVLPVNKFSRPLGWFFLAIGVYCLIITAGCGVLSRIPLGTEIGSDHGDAKGKPVRISESRSSQQESLTRTQLQTALMNFADRFGAMVFTATEEFEKEPASPEVRLAAARSRFYLSSSAFGIAAGPNPVIALLDMVVLTTPSRILWEESWKAQVFGGRAEVFVEGFRKLESDIWSIAAKVLTKPQMKELYAVILEWRDKHPDETAMSFTRFRDFGELRTDSPLADVTRSNGFFPEVSEAARAADEIRLLGDRAMYLLSRMQATSNLQVDLAYRELVTEPEIRQILADGNRFTNISDRFTGIVEQFPEKIAEERNAAINQFARMASNERKKLMEDLLSEEKAVKGLFADLRQILEAGNKLADRVNTTVNSIDTLAARFDTGPNPERLSIGDYRQIVSEFTVSTQQLNALVHSVDELLTSPKLEKSLPVAFKLTDRVEILGKTWMKDFFILGAALILMFFITLLLYRIISRRFVESRK
jgi:hypothetical protein